MLSDDLNGADVTAHDVYDATDHVVALSNSSTLVPTGCTLTTM